MHSVVLLASSLFDHQISLAMMLWHVHVVHGHVVFQACVGNTQLIPILAGRHRHEDQWYHFSRLLSPIWPLLTDNDMTFLLVIVASSKLDCQFVCLSQGIGIYEWSTSEARAH